MSRGFQVFQFTEVGKVWQHSFMAVGEGSSACPHQRKQRVGRTRSQAITIKATPPTSPAKSHLRKDPQLPLIVPLPEEQGFQR